MNPLLVAASGLAAGSLHVVTGADHLAALLPLAVGGRWRAFRLGVRWGLGHSLGVVLVGLLAVSFRELVDLHAVETWGERLVGVMLVAIGGLALRRALRLEIHAHRHAHEGAAEHAHLHVHAAGHAQAAAPESAHRHAHTAFVAGTLHGVAGTAHLLGVLPALALPGWLASALYLLAFAGGTVAAMAGFTAAVGEASARAAVSTRALKQLMYACSLATIAIGVVWLVGV